MTRIAGWVSYKKKKNKSLFLIKKFIDRPSFLNIYLYMLRSNRSVTNIEYIYIYMYKIIIMLVICFFYMRTFSLLVTNTHTRFNRKC